MYKPFPIFDSAEEFYSEKSSALKESALTKMSQILMSSDHQGHDWTRDYYNSASGFLIRYLGPNKSLNTFRRFRTEIERYTLWLLLKAKLNPMEVSWQQIVSYIEFLSSPDPSWISAYKTNRTVTFGDRVLANDLWRPFWARAKPGEKRAKRGTPERSEQDEKSISQYSSSKSTLEAALRALGPFYKHLIDQELLISINKSEADRDTSLISKKLMINSPIPEAVELIRKNKLGSGWNEDSKMLEHRLNNRQWSLLIEAAKLMASENPHRWTRALFIIVFVKSNLLSVSEICESKHGIPSMGQIRYDHQKKAWFYYSNTQSGDSRIVKIPEAVLPYLSLYRKQRGLDGPLPNPSEIQPILAKIGARKKLGFRRIEVGGIKPGTAYDDIRAVLRYCIKNIRQFHNFERRFLESDLLVLNNASSLWIRNTGICGALENGENPKEVFKKSGKKSPHTTLISYFELSGKGVN